MNTFLPRSPRIAPNVAHTLLVLVLVGLSINAVLGIVFQIGTVWSIVFCLGCIFVIVALQLGYVSRPAAPKTVPATALVLVIQALLVWVPIFSFGPRWHGFTGVLVASVLLLLPALIAWPLTMVILGGVVTFTLFRGPGLVATPWEVTYAVVATVNTGMIIYGMSRLVQLVTDLHAARHDLSRLAVVDERLRFTQDVHDLLGTSLSAIALKAELATRLLAQWPGRVREELADILVMSRRAIADVRRVASSKQGHSLDSEFSASGEEGQPHQLRVEVASPAAREASSSTAVEANETHETEVTARPIWLPSMAPNLAKAILATFFVGMTINSSVGVAIQNASLWKGFASAAIIVTLAVLQLGYVSRPDAFHTTFRTFVVLFGQLLLVFLPITFFGPTWHGLPGLFAGSALVLLRPAVALPLAGLTMAALGVLETVAGLGRASDWYAVPFVLIGNLITAMLMFALSRLVQIVAELHRIRHELSRVAVTQERLRFSRDVHDLLGLSLSAITLKTELADRLLADHPERARHELDDILVMARRGLTDVRSVASGRKNLSLDDEYRHAETALAAAGIDVTITRDDRELPDPIGTALATILREGITNVLRHSAASWCEITQNQVGTSIQLVIVNDGVAKPADLADLSTVDGQAIATPTPTQTVAPAGNGIRNLTHRVSTLDGELVADQPADGLFRLRVELPLHPPHPVTPVSTRA